MTQVKIGMSLANGNLYKFAASSALALSALIGGAMLSGGEANALECTFGAPPPNGIKGCSYGATWPGGGLAPWIPAGPPTVVINQGANGYYEQWYETNIQVNNVDYYYPTDKDIWFKSGPSVGSGNIEWTWEDINKSGTWLIPPDPHSVDTWTVDVDFNPNLTPADGASIFDYFVIIDKGQGGEPHLPWNKYFEDVTLGVVFGPSVTGELSYVTKEIWSAVCTSSTPGGIYDSCAKDQFIKTLKVDELTPGALDIVDITSLKLDKLYILDTAVAKSNDIGAYSNVFRQVPGPLPILGASLALGSVRKLRNLTSRLKVHSMG